MSGRQRHASTVLLTHRDLSTVFEAERMRKRSYRHLVLGLALSPLFDLHSLQDFSKAVLAALTDVESLPETAGSSTSPPAGVSSNASMMMGLGGEKRGVVSSNVSIDGSHLLFCIIIIRLTSNKNPRPAQPVRKQAQESEKNWYIL